MPIEFCEIGKTTKIPYPKLVNIYHACIGENCMIGPFVEIQSGVIIGNDCRIQSHSFICTNTIIGNNVFIGHGVVFVNDRYPPRTEGFWEEIRVSDGVIIGSNSTILPCMIGTNAIVGAGSVVARDVPSGTIVYGNPAK